MYGEDDKRRSICDLLNECRETLDSTGSSLGFLSEEDSTIV